MELRKKCRICNESYPATLEFWYKHPQSKDGLKHECKTCTKKRANVYQATKPNSTPLGRPNENVFIDYLQNHGVAAEMGAIFKAFKYADVVAWGCITIELKYSRSETGKHVFIFTPRQQRLNCEGLGIICLAVDTGKETSYHFFDARNPIFYKDGKLKASISYHPNAKHRKNKPVLMPDMMAMAKNNFALIEQKRVSYSQQLIEIARAA